jgi:hypothetical protein
MKSGKITKRRLVEFDSLADEELDGVFGGDADASGDFNYGQCAGAMAVGAAAGALGGGIFGPVGAVVGGAAGAGAVYAWGDACTSPPGADGGAGGDGGDGGYGGS